MSVRPQVLAYYFPSWHRDPRNEQWFGSGWTEWELLQFAEPRFAGHRQPRIPALGYQDDSEPSTFDEQIPLATRSGIDGFLFDYYWYDDGPYLERALDEGFLGSESNPQMKFALMWANHELVDIFPATDPAARRRLKHGELDLNAFRKMTDHVIAKYFSRENYLKIDGKPFFSIYEIGRFINGLGSVAAAAEAVRDFERRTIAAGHPGLHLDCVLWGFGVLPEATTVTDPKKLIDEIGFSSATSYVWIHHADSAGSPFPRGDWRSIGRDAFEDYERNASNLTVPVYPNVTVGWDATPRIAPTATFTQGPYPWLPVWDATPADFEWGLRRALEFLERHDYPHPIVTINAWNEWTEGSALLPDVENGTAFLDKVRMVLGVPDGAGAPAGS